jgi:hypothetical protein
VRYLTKPRSAAPRFSLAGEHTSHSKGKLVAVESVNAWLEHWKPVADWLVAAGTILLGILAVFGGRIERWWRYPDLSIETDKRFVWDTYPDEGHRILVLLCVKNRAGVAESAEIFLETVSRKGPGKGDTSMKDIVPMSFRWIHREADQPEIFVTIATGMRRYWMLGAMKHRHNSENVYFQLFTESKLRV